MPSMSIRPSAAAAAATAALLLLGIGLGWLDQRLDEPAADMAFVPEGVFRMGSDEGEVDERPAHEVSLSGYWIDLHEVTNDQFAAFVKATGHLAQGEADWRQPEGPGSSVEARGGHPVVQVSWDEARAYCAWAGKRLPSEAEWEKAARDGDGRRFPWGDEPADGTRANYADRNTRFAWRDSTVDDGYGGTAPIGQYPDGASPAGALDLAGNVWEWVADYYGGSYYAASPEGDPQGPAEGEHRVIRGGSWLDPPDRLRVSYRSWRHPTDRRSHLGFRCARDP